MVAHGLDRIVLAMQMQNIASSAEQKKRVAVIPVNETMKGEALKISQMLRESGIAVELEVMGRKMAKALEDADKRGMDYAVIVGERELRQGKAMIKDLAKRTQAEVKIPAIAEKIKN